MRDGATDWLRELDAALQHRANEILNARPRGRLQAEGDNRRTDRERGPGLAFRVGEKFFFSG